MWPQVCSNCACLVSVQVSAPYVIAGSTQELQAEGKVAFEEIPVFGILYAVQPTMVLRYISLSWFLS